MDDNNCRRLPASVLLTTEEIVNSGNTDNHPAPDISPSTETDDVGTGEMQPHPYADMFPMMTGEDFDALVASIKEHKLEEPIIKYKGEILDGRNRYAACNKAGVKPEFEEYGKDDPLGFVLRKNLHRRQLQTSQRAMIAAKMANLPQGGDHKSDDFKTSNDGLKIEAAAKFLNVSPKTVERAKAVLTCDDGELIKAVESGEMSVSAAAKQLAEPPAPVENLSEGKIQSQRLVKLWTKTGDEGQALFLEAIGATM